MEKLRTAFFVSCLIMILVVSLSGVSSAEKTPRQKCLDSCTQTKLVCFNINADKRACEVAFQSCSKDCQKEPDVLPDQPGEDTSSAQPVNKSQNDHSSVPR